MTPERKALIAERKSLQEESRWHRYWIDQNRTKIIRLEMKAKQLKDEEFSNRLKN